MINGAPFDDENDFGVAIGIAFDAERNYAPERYGWQPAPELAPRFNYGATSALGARLAIPVRSIS